MWPGVGGWWCLFLKHNLVFISADAEKCFCFCQSVHENCPFRHLYFFFFKMPVVSEVCVCEILGKVVSRYSGKHAFWKVLILVCLPYLEVDWKA